MLKKGQFALIVIIGLFILITISLLITFNPKFTENAFNKGVSLEKEKVKSLIQSCLELVSQEALLISNMQGGQINLLENFLNVGPITTSFLLFNEIANTVDKEKMEKDISKYIENSMKKCVDFSTFKNAEIKTENIQATTTIDEDLVTIKINWPIEIRDQGTVTKFSKFETNYKITLYNMINTVNRILEILGPNPSYLDLGVFGEFNEKVTNINLQPRGDSFTFVNQDANTNINNNTFSFMFATQPRIKNENLPPEVEAVPDLVAPSGEPFTYQIKATDPEGETLTFVSISPLTTIDPNTGIIAFTPSYVDIGNHTIAITVIDESFNKVENRISLQITGVNRPPEIQSENQNILVGETLTYSPSIFYIGEPLRYGLLSGPTNAQINSSTGTITWLSSEPGVYEFTIGISNNLHSVINKFKVNVTAFINNPPHVYAPDQNLKSGEKLDNNKIIIVDEEGDDITIDIHSPSSAIFRNNNIEWSTTSIGNYVFNITLSDGFNNVNKIFNVEVR